MTDCSLEISALGRLIERGCIKAGTRNQGLIKRWDAARWIAPSTRKDEWLIRSGARAEIEKRLAMLLPDWQSQFAHLRGLGRDPLAPADIEALPMLRRQATVSQRKINRRNWNAATGLGPKHTSKVVSEAVLTRDWVLRFRPNIGLRGDFGTEQVDFFEEARRWTECLIPERAWFSLSSIVGTMPELIVTCENVGAYVDFPATDSMLIIYSPGADIEAAAALLQKLPAVPWVHFGDLDPEGIDIGHRLARNVGRTFHIYIPSFASEYLDDAARPTKTLWTGTFDIPILSDLRSRNKRLFQEVFMLDERLASDVSALVKPFTSSS